jgi:hypothetical protein
VCRSALSAITGITRKACIILGANMPAEYCALLMRLNAMRQIA